MQSQQIFFPGNTFSHKWSFVNAERQDGTPAKQIGRSSNQTQFRHEKHHKGLGPISRRNTVRKAGSWTNGVNSSEAATEFQSGAGNHS
jgi:hypothetical protein